MEIDIKVLCSEIAVVFFSVFSPLNNLSDQVHSYMICHRINITLTI